ncbi:MAG: SDR family NAD(P)-dependent oxidoreductase [Ilumatobacteraceae bacterium]
MQPESGSTAVQSDFTPGARAGGVLDGSVAFITGAGSGLGAAFARRLAADGAHVVVNDISPEAAGAVARSVDGSVAVFDVCDSAAFDAAVARTADRHGRLDIMINNACIAPPVEPAASEKMIAAQMLRMEGRIAEMGPAGFITGLSDAAWDRMIKVHLYGTFYGTRAALRHMQRARAGVIINISSILGQLPSAAAPHYSAAKAAIIALTKSAAQETAHLGIRINAVCPGYVDTPLLDPYDDTIRAGIKMQIASGRMGRPEELAELVRFLAGPESSYCTGDIFTASGGYA